jgi:PRTRC genetic system protein E
MFKELFELIPDKGGIRFALTRTGPDTMAVVLVPEFPAPKGEPPKLTPLSVSGSVDELEAGFVEAVLAYKPSVEALSNNLSQAKASMEEGKKSGKAKGEPKPAPPPQASMFDASEDGCGNPTPTGALRRAQAGSASDGDVDEAPAEQDPKQEGEDHGA